MRNPYASKLIGLLLLAACSGAPVKPLPPWYSSATADHPKYGRAKYIAGPGLSTISAEDADVKAKAYIATQISAQVQSEISSFQQFIANASGGNTNENVVSKSVV